MSQNITKGELLTPVRNKQYTKTPMHHI